MAGGVVEGRTLGAPPAPRTKQELAAVARIQRGLLTRQECLSAGMSDRAIRWRLDRGGWTSIHVHGLIREPPPIIELVVDRERRVATPVGTKVHRRTSVNRAVDELHWPWRTTVEETILDVSHKGPSDELMPCWAEPSSAVADGAESAMEVRYLRDVERAHGLPTGRRQHTSVSGGRELHDVAYDEQRVLVELDGRLGHEGFEAQRKDGRRDRRGAGSGWLSARAYWDDVALTPCQLAVEVGSILHSRGWDRSPLPCRRRPCAVREGRSSGAKLPL